MNDDLVTVGRIATAHGIRGELAVDPETDNPERFAPGSTLLLVTPKGEVSPRRVVGARPHQDRLLVTLEGVPDRTAAEALRGCRLCVREADLPALPPGRVWRHDLPGMAVVAEDGAALGTVKELLGTGGGNEVLVVEGPRGELLVPFSAAVVRGIDAAARRVVVRLPDGLLAG
jgi:16S rRNA processing protein RimM